MKSSHYDPSDNWPWHCYKCGYDLCGNCIGVTPGIETDAENDVKKLVSPHFLSGLLSLENFVQILDETPNDISVIAAQRVMPSLLDLVKESYVAFCLAESALHQINKRMDKTLQIVVVEEKNANDSLMQTKETLAILERKVEVLEEERDELSDQLSKLDLNLQRDKESLRQRREQLEQAERDRNNGTTLGAVLGAVFGGPLGALAGHAIADRVHSTDVSNAEQAVSQASSQVRNTQRRLAAKKTELCELTNKKDKQQIYKRWNCQELELLKTRKEDIKESQRRLAKLNESIKNCTQFVDTTTTRAKMMADEAKGELPDIEVMIPPLKAIAGDVAETSLSNSRLLSGQVDMEGIGNKIKMITSQRLKSITSDDGDQWA